MIFQKLSADMKFRKAFDLWLAHRTIEGTGNFAEVSYISEKTRKDYLITAAALTKFFGELKIGDIHAGHLMEYQRARAVCDQSAANWSKPAKSNTIRKEVTLLIRILQAAGLWTDEKKMHYRPVRSSDSDVRGALTPEEQHRLLHVASSRAEWQVVYWYAILALQTTAGCKELRTLRLGDILLRDSAIQIRKAGAKNKYRIRTIPLVTQDVHWAIERLIERARELGSVAPQHYLFPVHVTQERYDPTVPMTEWGLRDRWDAVRKAAGLPSLRIYDLRHTAITRLVEAGTPLPVVMSMAGHMTPKMTQHYTAVSLSSKTSWMRAAWSNGMQQAPAPARFGPASVGVDLQPQRRSG